MLEPEFFLGSVLPGWSPRVVVVFSGVEIVGILYARERVIAGITSGVVYVDASLDDALIAETAHREEAFRVALELLLALPGIRGVRIRIQRGGFESDPIRRVIARNRLDVRCSRVKRSQSRIWKSHAHLELADTFDGFLGRLGSTTRHNFRYYRRRFEAAGHRFVDSLTKAELRTATHALTEGSKIHHSHWVADKLLGWVEGSRQPFAAGLQHRDGSWMAVVGGWYRCNSAVLCFQRNSDIKFSEGSLSIVLRGYLIEALIRQSIRELVIWADTSPPLSRYATYTQTFSVHLDKPTHLWRGIRFAASTVGPFLPRRFAEGAQWLTAVLLTVEPSADVIAAFL